MCAYRWERRDCQETQVGWNVERSLDFVLKRHRANGFVEKRILWFQYKRLSVKQSYARYDWYRTHVPVGRKRLGMRRDRTDRHPPSPRPCTDRATPPRHAQTAQLRPRPRLDTFSTSHQHTHTHTHTRARTHACPEAQIQIDVRGAPLTRAAHHRPLWAPLRAAFLASRADMPFPPPAPHAWRPHSHYGAC